MLKNEAKERSKEIKFDRSTVFDQEGRPATSELKILLRVFIGHSFSVPSSKMYQKNPELDLAAIQGRIS